MGKFTICIDFDGVIHLYSKGWNDGSIYDGIVPGFFEWAINASELFRLVIYSSRSATSAGTTEMREWLSARAAEWHAENGHSSHLPDFEFAHEKPAAFLSIDDRAVTFTGDWNDFDPAKLAVFKPWSQKIPAIRDLERITDLARSPGNADYCEYMRGMANGLTLALSIMNGTEPQYIEYVPSTLNSNKDFVITSQAEAGSSIIGGEGGSS